MKSIEKKIYETLSKYINSPDEIISKLIEIGEIHHYKKNEIVKDYHSNENQIRLIIKGCIGYFTKNQKVEKCFYFTFDDEIAVDYSTYVKDHALPIKLIALSATQVFVINKNDFNQFCEHNPLAKDIKNHAVELLLIDTLREYLDLLNLSATERYINLLKRKNNIAQKIDHKHIASYIGITPQSLSRLRKKLLYE